MREQTCQDNGSVGVQTAAETQVPALEGEDDQEVGDPAGQEPHGDVPDPAELELVHEEDSHHSVAHDVQVCLVQEEGSYGLVQVTPIALDQLHVQQPFVHLGREVQELLVAGGGEQDVDDDEGQEVERDDGGGEREQLHVGQELVHDHLQVIVISVGAVSVV